jgi:hypothetical protein
MSKETLIGFYTKRGHGKRLPNYQPSKGRSSRRKVSLPQGKSGGLPLTLPFLPLPHRRGQFPQQPRLQWQAGRTT